MDPATAAAATTVVLPVPVEWILGAAMAVVGSLVAAVLHLNRKVDKLQQQFTDAALGALTQATTALAAATEREKVYDKWLRRANAHNEPTDESDTKQKGVDVYATTEVVRKQRR